MPVEGLYFGRDSDLFQALGNTERSSVPFIQECRGFPETVSEVIEEAFLDECSGNTFGKGYVNFTELEDYCLKNSSSEDPRVREAVKGVKRLMEEVSSLARIYYSREFDSSKELSVRDTRIIFWFDF